MPSAGLGRVVAGGRYLETHPALLKLGANTAIFPLDDTQFKSEATDWEFRDRIPAGSSIDALTILVYTPQGGTVTLRDLRLLTRGGESAQP